ncbi:unnamed protein product [Spirodela intermedia]|uniref:Reverse transcriptase domain-containing protein n=1 Tax=Spirodela intermedia TaxID=51605 RepID=A0A7I8K8U6_SPIIN|nr:unnamed protein product [Spirodela intermedia]
MNQVLKPFIRTFVFVYFNNILIYSIIEEEHHHHLRSILTILQQNKLFINLKKCKFLTSSLVFLGYIVSTNGIKVDEEKVESIKDWPILKNIHDVCSFHSFAFFYRRFIQNFNLVMAPITVHEKKKLLVDKFNRHKFYSN